MIEREIKRYAAYFRGWCQAFGEHEGLHGMESGIDWLFADHQVGLVLPKPMIRPLYREVLLHEEVPLLAFSPDSIHVGALELSLGKRQEKRALEAIAQVLANEEEAHIYLTSHLLYGSGNRIITFSNRKPVMIIYKEIGTMRVQVSGEPEAIDRGPAPS